MTETEDFFVTQLATPRASGNSDTRSMWWTTTIAPAATDGCDAVLARIVTPLAAQAKSWGAERWFYSRCMDPRKPSVVVSVLGNGPLLKRLESLERALVAQSVACLGELQTSYSLEEVRAEGGANPSNEAALAKYGGPQGLALAEEVFEFSSDLAAWGIARFPKATSRSSLAALLLFDAGYAMMRGPRSSTWPDRRSVSWDYFWDSHLRSCTAASGPRAAHVRGALTAQLAPKIWPAHRLMAATASEASVENWRRRWSKTIDTYLHRADKARVSRSAQHLTVYQSHLALNRLGICLADEAALGLYARAWSKEREQTLLAARIDSR